MGATQQLLASYGGLAKNGLLDSLVSYYKFNENTGTTAGDSHGSNDGTLVRATRATGKINSGVETNTSTSSITSRYVDIGTQITADFTDSDFSISMWIYPKSITAIKNYLVFYGRDIGLDYRAGNGFLFGIYDGTTFHTASYSTGISINNWYNVLVTRSKTNGFILYVGGENRDSKSFTGNGLTVTTGTFATTKIGFRPVEDYPSDAKIDEVGIRNRALTADEVTSLYNGGNGLPYDNFTL